MTLINRSRPLVFREGVVHETAAKVYACAGNGDTRDRQRHPKCLQKIGRGYGGYNAERHAHLRRGSQRHCHYCATMFFLDAEATYPPIRWTPCQHCGKDYMRRRLCHAITKGGSWKPSVHAAYDLKADSFHVSYSGECSCAEAKKEHACMRALNAELQRRLSPLMKRMFR